MEFWSFGVVEFWSFGVVLNEAKSRPCGKRNPAFAHSHKANAIVSVARSFRVGTTEAPVKIMVRAFTPF